MNSMDRTIGPRRHKVTFFNAKRGFGFLEGEVGKSVFFHITNVADRTTPEIGDAYWYESEIKPDGNIVATTMAKEREMLHAPAPAATSSHRLIDWAHVPFLKSHHMSKAMGSLAKRILEEDWRHQADRFESADALGGLRNYLLHTFTRLSHEGKICEGGDYAAFNTGLVSRSYEPIYALFERNERFRPEWKWRAFCEADATKGYESQLLVQSFGHNLPRPARYIRKLEDIMFDGDAPIDYNLEHVIKDGIRHDRYPTAFLEQHVPAFSTQTYDSFANKNDLDAYLGEIADGLDEDGETFKAFRTRLNSVMARAKKRTRQNYRLAVPQYYPQHNELGFLLPLTLVEDSKVDAAMVIQSLPGKKHVEYYARTIYSLSYAYRAARLVGRPVGDWLASDKMLWN